MRYIEKIKLRNFKRFETFTAELSHGRNIIIGDNEAGKTSLLTAIDLVISGSRSKVEAIGVEHLFNADAIERFLLSDRKYENLPFISAELYFNSQDNPDLNGKINLDERTCDGIRLLIEPNDDLGKEIRDILSQKDASFPFEFYTISFKTFSGESFSSYKKYLNHLLIDSSQMNSEHATREYVKNIYQANVTENKDRYKHNNEYRNHKEQFKNTVLGDLNRNTQEYSFGLRSTSKSNLETDLILFENGISIEHRGKGKQCFIKTDFALRSKQNSLDVILIEEPENHLSHLSMKKLIGKISNSNDKQLIIATHSDLISARLDLRSCLLINSSGKGVVSLSHLPDTTAKFFMKAPNNSILQYILSKKVILVEGDSEFILMEALFKNVTGKELEGSDVHVISVGGTSFKRYMDIGKILKIKTAVVRDNDKDYQAKCVDAYDDYKEPTTKVFADMDNSRYTFEIAFYKDNTTICNKLFSEGRRTLSVEEYMLSNKADCAFTILDNVASPIVVPTYIKNAIQWINS